MLLLFITIVLLLCIYTLRHYVFTMNRLFGTQRHPYIDVETAEWPPVTVLIAAHNEESVILGILEALLEVDYPPERLHIMPVNDRSTDRTRAIIDAFVAEHLGCRIVPFHRERGRPGKAAALKDATELVLTDLMLFFDADYIPGPALIKQLVAPFFDPEVGSTMGRVVPMNASKNLLTRLLDLERSGGYQVDQQARMNLGLVPQYGGTVGGVRRRALLEIGGWNVDALSEDTDLTYRLLLQGWKTVYQNRSECYEEAPEQWPVRIRQIKRWATGHNQAMLRYAIPTLFCRRIAARERLDGLLLLCVYATGPALIVGWVLAVVLFYRGLELNGLIFVLFLAAFSTLGNFAAFFEVAAAAHLDGSRERLRLLPLLLFSFTVSLVSVSNAAWQQILRAFRPRELVWDKTERFRQLDPKQIREAA
jgi:cellulose synthase/poly-beta-1,6-N-acetylglucosamine synthase-like glycosyltransferase